MDLGPDWRRTVAEARATIEAMTADECLACADLARSIKPMLRADSTRAVAEREARSLEALALRKTVD